MPIQRLQKFEAQLFNYVLGNTSEHLSKKGYADLLRPSIGREGKPPRKASALSDAQWAMLVGDDDPDAPDRPVLLADRDFADLQEAVGNWPSKLRWRPNQQLHKRYVGTVKEVRDELGQPVADEWAEACIAFAKRLERRLPLVEGIGVVHEWVSELRRLLREMTVETSGAQISEDDLKDLKNLRAALKKFGVEAKDDKYELSVLKELRAAIQKLGIHAKADKVREEANVATKRGRDVLRVLQLWGEYEGFARQRPGRYR